MWKRILGSSLMIGTLSGAPVIGQAQLLVVNQGDRTLSVIDPVSAATIASIHVGGVTGHEVAVSRDHRTAFVPIYGDSGVGRPGTDGRSVAVIDLSTHRLKGTMEYDHGVRPHCALYDTHRDLLYVTAELNHTITVINPNTLRIISAIPTGAAESHMLVLSHDGQRAYTANVGPGSVSVLDLDTRKTLAVIPVAPSVQRISISLDDRMVFTADQHEPRLAVIDTTTDKVSHWIPLPGIGYGTAFTEGGRYLLVTLPDAGKVAVVDLRSLTTLRTFTVGRGPVQILMRPKTHTAYISCPLDGTVAELAVDGDVSTWHLRRIIKAGAGADGMAWVGQ